ncbi:MAG: WD40 repeat protein [Lentisphaeria bacterium]|jgi:WD40 repeat protein
MRAAAATVGVWPIKRKTFASPLAICAALSAPLFIAGCDRASAPTTSLEVATAGAHSAALSDDGAYSVIGSINHGGSFWRNIEQERVFNWNHKQDEYTTIVSADFSSDGKWALTANPFNLVLWNTQTGKSERFWTAPGEVLDAELGPGANTAILGLSDHTAVIFDIRRGGILATLNHQNRVRSVDLSDDGKLAITGSEDYTAVLWDLPGGDKRLTLKHDDDVQLVKLSPDGRLALSVSKYDKALLWRTESGEVVGEMPLQSEHIKRGIRFISARFNSSGTHLLTGRPDQIVELWDTDTLNQIDRWKLPKRDYWKPTSTAALELSFSSDPSVFYAIASNGFVHTLQRKTSSLEQ